MSWFDDLGREVAEDQERRSKQLDLAAVRAGIAHRVALLPRRHAVRGRRILAWASVPAALIALALAWHERRPTPEFRIGGGASPQPDHPWISAPADGEVPIDFRDGSRVMLADRARARIVNVDGSDTTIELDQGRAELDIVRHTGKRWHVEVGPYVVQVTGTRFNVGWNPRTSEFTLQMREGKVLVAGCGIDSKALAGSEFFRASCKEGKSEIGIAGESRDERPSPSAGTSDPLPKTLEPTAVPPSVVSHAPQTRRDRGSEARSATTADVSETPNWRELADRGRYREALAAVETLGFDAQCERLPSSDLLVLGNASRMAGRAAQADRAFLVLRKRFPRDTAASIAAFNLARVAFDLTGDYPRAIKWFRTYLQERPAGPLAREAHGRLIESLERKGDGDGARQSATSYLERYPDGPHAELSRRLLK